MRCATKGSAPWTCYRDDNDGVFGAELNCDELARISGADEIATLSGEVHFGGCTFF